MIPRAFILKTNNRKEVTDFGEDSTHNAMTTVPDILPLRDKHSEATDTASAAATSTQGAFCYIDCRVNYIGVVAVVQNQCVITSQVPCLLSKQFVLILHSLRTNQSCVRLEQRMSFSMRSSATRLSGAAPNASQSSWRHHALNSRHGQAILANALHTSAPAASLISFLGVVPPSTGLSKLTQSPYIDGFLA